MLKRKPYAQPCVTRYESEAEYPARTRRIVRSLRQELAPPQFEVHPQYVTVVDSDRRYVEVSDSFCQLVGYQREELVGKQYDALTAPNTNDIPTVFGLFQELGYMHGMWMLVTREGTRILVRYESWLRPDSLHRRAHGGCRRWVLKDRHSPATAEGSVLILNRTLTVTGMRYNLRGPALRANIPETPVILLIKEQGTSRWARWTYRHLHGPPSQEWPDDRRRAI